MWNLPASGKGNDEAVVWKWTLGCLQRTVVTKCKLRCRTRSAVTKSTFKCVQLNVNKKNKISRLKYIKCIYIISK